MKIFTSSFLENFKMAIDTLRASKLRSFLTIFGVVIGVVTVMAISSMISGIKIAVEKQVESFGTRSIFLYNADKFWSDYREAYRESLSTGEGGRFVEFEKVLFTEGRGDLKPKALQAALFITLYREMPIFQYPFELLNTLAEIDELLSNWRYRHFSMVRRMIGIRAGTGGTSGAGYLEGTLASITLSVRSQNLRHS